MNERVCARSRGSGCAELQNSNILRVGQERTHAIQHANNSLRLAWIGKGMEIL